MKLIKQVFLIIFLLSSFINAYSIVPDRKQLPKYPAYKEVFRRLLLEYSISSIGFPNEFSLVKKPNGWHAMIIDKSIDSTLQDELFWDRAMDKFNSLSLEPSDSSSLAEDKMQMINDWSNNYFTRILPYWGYVGWDRDLIREYENEPDLSDTLLNALARAYCSYASNLLNNNTGLSSKELRFKLPKGQNALSQDQLAEYRKYEHKGIDSYYKLWQLNPDFENFIGDVYTVYSNEVMNCYLTILYHQNEEEAKKEIRAGLYDSFFINMAMRYLASCDGDAILLVNGDSDTFPLLYVQESKNYRKDVTVVNYSMLGSGRYLSHLFDKRSGREPLQFQMARNIYQSELKQVFYLRDSIPEMEIREMIDFVASKDPATKLAYGAVLYDMIPTKKLKLSFNLQNLPETYKTNISPDQNPMIIVPPNEYLLLNEFGFLDFLSTAEFRRPIYVGMTVAKESYFNLAEYMQWEGLAFKITPFKHEKPKDFIVSTEINTDVQYKKLLTDLNIHISDNNFKYYEDHKKLVHNYNFVYGSLAEKLVDENKLDSAGRVLDYCRTEFSTDKVEPDYFSLVIIESYYRIRNQVEADKLANQLFSADMKAFAKMPVNINSKDYELRLAMYILERLSELSSKYSQDTELTMKIEDYYKSMKTRYNVEI